MLAALYRPNHTLSRFGVWAETTGVILMAALVLEGLMSGADPPWWKVAVSIGLVVVGVLLPFGHMAFWAFRGEK